MGSGTTTDVDGKTETLQRQHTPVDSDATEVTLRILLESGGAKTETVRLGDPINTLATALTTAFLPQVAAAHQAGNRRIFKMRSTERDTFQANSRCACCPWELDC